MSTEQKHILAVGDNSAYTRELLDTLSAQGFVVHTEECRAATPDLLDEMPVDILLISHLHDCAECKSILQASHSNQIKKTIPAFVVVEDAQSIQEALSLGAVDYITSQDDIQSVIVKFRALFSKDSTHSGSTAIDITPAAVPRTAHGVRVYVVEDDPLLRNLLAIRFDRSDFAYEFNVNGDQAVAEMRQFKPDVIILDLMLPGKSGFEVLEAIKADSKLAAVPVMVFSNRDEQSDRQRAKDLGAEAFNVKAMTDLSSLITKIQALAKV